MPPVRRRFLGLLAIIAITFVAGAIGSAATFPNVRTWYPTIIKPSWTPPNALFGPVWTTLYVAMSIAFWRVWRQQREIGAPSSASLYGLQLALNALWSILFFGLKRPDLALLEIVALWALLVTLLVRFARVDRIAGLLWAPYVAWVTYAVALNAAIVALNR